METDASQQTGFTTPAVHTGLLLGPPRSGTTLISHLLAGGDRVLSLSEPFLARTTLPHWRLRRIFHYFQYTAGFRPRSAPYRGSLEEFSRFLRQMAVENDCHYLAIKETYRREGLIPQWRNEPLLDRLVQAADGLVALIRHPYDIAASSIRLCRWATGFRSRILHLWWKTVPAFQNPTDVVRWAADNWVSYVQWIRPRGLTLLRYEDFVADPHRQLPVVCRQLKVPFQKKMIDDKRRLNKVIGLGDPSLLVNVPPIHQNSVGHGRQLTDQQQRIVRDACEHLAPEFDYSL